MPDSMGDTSLRERAEYFARQHGIDPPLVCAVIEQESSWNVWAIRYEPAFFAKYVAPQTNLSETERHARATSWGLMQTMGQVARERGFTQTFLSALCDPEFGLAVGCEFLAHLLKRHNSDQAAALNAWNGGGNPAYANQVLARVDKYR